MSKTRFALAGMMSVLPTSIMAHTTDVPHSHPHLMQLDLSQALPPTLLLLTAAALFYAASVVVRRRK